MAGRRRAARRCGCSSTGDAAWWEALATLVYGSHFVVTPLVLGVLWVRDRARWARCARLVARALGRRAGHLRALSGGAAVAGRQGRRHRAGARLSGAGWEVLGLPRAGALLADSQGQVNQVAAVPSLHTAFAVLACLVLYRSRSGRGSGPAWSPTPC